MTSAPVISSPVSIARILVATDFSPYSDKALHYALPIADAYGSELFVLHVLQPEPLPLPTAEYSLPADFERREAQEHYRWLEESGIFGGRRHSLLLETGGIGDRVAQTVKDNHIELVVVGTHGHGGLGTLLLGSSAEGIFRRVTCPVLTIGPRVGAVPGGFKFKRVLFATDYEAGSMHALPYALSFLHDEHAELMLLHVLTSGGWAPSVAQAMIDEGTERLRQVVPEGTALATEPVATVDFGSPAEVIVRVAEQRGADLIVMGVRAAKSADRTAHVPWTVAHRVLRHAHCPVLTVRG